MCTVRMRQEPRARARAPSALEARAQLRLLPVRAAAAPRAAQRSRSRSAIRTKSSTNWKTVTFITCVWGACPAPNPRPAALTPTASLFSAQVYVCKKNVKLDNEKDLKKKHAELVKKGKKIKKKGPKR